MSFVELRYTNRKRNVDDVMDESSCHLALGKRIEVAVDKP